MYKGDGKGLEARGILSGIFVRVPLRVPERGFSRGLWAELGLGLAKGLG